MKKIAPPSKATSAVATSNEPFKCLRCSKKFKQASGLEYHMKFKVCLKKIKVLKIKNVHSKQKILECPLCRPGSTKPPGHKGRHLNKLPKVVSNVAKRGRGRPKKTSNQDVKNKVEEEVEEQAIKRQRTGNLNQTEQRTKDKPFLCLFDKARSEARRSEEFTVLRASKSVKKIITPRTKALQYLMDEEMTNAEVTKSLLDIFCEIQSRTSQIMSVGAEHGYEYDSEYDDEHGAGQRSKEVTEMEDMVEDVLRCWPDKGTFRTETSFERYYYSF